jgi:anti-repressor protein
MNNLQLFRFSNSLIRVVLINNEPWWVAKDICELLGYSWQKNLINHVPDEWKGLSPINTPGGIQDLLCLSEQGLYFFLARSDKGGALPFQKWIVGEVLPSIRKTGSYSLTSKLPQTFAEALRLAADQAEEIERQAKQLLEQAPKVQLADQCLSATNSQPMNTVAKELGIGRNKLFSILRSKKILNNQNLPYQTYLDRGYFEVKLRPIAMNDTKNYAQTFVFARGLNFIRTQLRGELCTSL